MNYCLSHIRIAIAFASEEMVTIMLPLQVSLIAAVSLGLLNVMCIISCCLYSHCFFAR